MKLKCLFFGLLLVVGISWTSCREAPSSHVVQSPDIAKQAVQFDRTQRPIIYTKHAKCRMDCRNIDKSEVEDILMKGRINYEKSEPHGKPDPKFALEGTTRDRQNVRIIFASSPKSLVVITCIDLKEDWVCHCN